MIRETIPCDICGRETPDGMTSDYECLHVCPECFEKYMDDTYGKHQWMCVNDDGCDGFYIARDDSVIGGYVGTGIYYTTFESECDDEEDGEDDSEPAYVTRYEIVERSLTGSAFSLYFDTYSELLERVGSLVLEYGQSINDLKLFEILCTANNKIIRKTTIWNPEQTEDMT